MTGNKMNLEALVLVESVRDYAIFMLEPGGTVATWNAGARAIKQYTASEIIGSSIERFYTPEDRAAGKPQRMLARAAADGRVQDEGWRVRKDGTRFWADVVISAVVDDAGALIGFVKVTRDLTERRARLEHQQALNRIGLHALQNRDLSLVMQHVVEVVAGTLRADLSVLFEHAPSDVTLVARASAGAHVRGSISAMPDTHAGAALQALTPVGVGDLQLEDRFHVGAVLEAAKPRSGVAVAVPAPNEGEGPWGVLAVYTREVRQWTADEIHFIQAVVNVVAVAVDRRRAEESMLAAQTVARRERSKSVVAHAAVRERDDFISIAAHELRTPLTALQLKLQGLDQILRKREHEPRVVERLSGALRQTSRLTGLVERLLDVSRIIGGRLVLSPEDVDLVAVTKHVIDDIAETAAAAACPVTLHAPASIIGHWDRQRLEQVVTNLVTNAMKYGAGKPITLRLDCTEDSARLVVEDLGIGIPTDDVARIFGRFERAVPVEHYAGLGIGLYIARAIVEAHGGSIDVRSQEGKGSQFEIRIPRSALDDARC